jgi:hypothetical protein
MVGTETRSMNISNIDPASIVRGATASLPRVHYVACGGAIGPAAQQGVAAAEARILVGWVSKVGYLH